MAADFIPILIHLMIAAGMGAALIIVTHLLGPKKPSARKLDVYECGVPPVGSARSRFSIRFYLIAVLFVLFDVEAIFLFPWAIVFKRLLERGAFIFFEMLAFILVLFAGLAYAWLRGALEWE
ncbi:MAG: NADH-quinone oxidoreductase subunit A [bacterium]